MNRKAMSKKVIALTLLSTMIFPEAVYAKDINKDESVYVTTDASGNVNKRIVSDWLHSNNGGNINDKSILTDIKNVKGDDKPVISGENLTWSVKGNDVYYQGLTDKQLPLSVKITYYMDGNEVSPQDISGKSGKFKINLEVINNDAHKVSIKGEEKTIYTPFAAAAVINLPDKHFKNIKVSSGTILSDGNNNVVTFAALPGLKESLGIDDANLNLGVDLKNSITIEGDANNFQLGSILLTATPKVGELNELSNIKEMDDLRTALGDLKDASNKLVDGGKKLSDGVNLASSKLNDSLSQLNSADNKKKVSLITNDEKVQLSRKLIDDGLTMEHIDTSLLESSVALLSKDNLALGNKIYGDLRGQQLQKLIQSGIMEKVMKITSDPSFNNNLQALSDLLDDKVALDQSLTPEKINSLMSLVDLLTNNLDGLKNIMNTSAALGQADLTSLGTVNELLSQADSINSKLDSLAGYAKELNTLKASLDSMTQEVGKASAAATQLDKNKALTGTIENIIKSSAVTEDQKAGLIAYLEGSKEFIGNMAVSLPKTQAFMKDASTKLQGVQGELSSPQNAAMIAKLKTILAKENIQKLQGMLASLQQSQKLLKDNATALNALNKFVGTVNKEDLIKVKTLTTKTLGDLQKNKNNIDLLMASLQTIKDTSSAELLKELKTLQGDLAAAEPLIKTLDSQMTPEQLNKLMSAPQMIDQLLAMKQDLVKGDEILTTTKEALAQKNVDQVKELLSKTPELLKGINDLKDGANMLSDGLDKFNTDGIEKLDSKGTEGLDKVQKIEDSANELIKLSNNYGAFSGMTDEMSSNIKFIYKTEEIKGKEVKQEIKVEKKEEKKGFFAWLVGLFN